MIKLKQLLLETLERVGQDPKEERPDMPVNWNETDVQILDKWSPKTIQEFMALPKTFRAIYPAIVDANELNPRFSEEELEFGGFRI